MYADDTVVFTHGKNANEAAKTVTTEMSKVVTWLQSCCLTLNVDKTVAMYFTNKRISTDCPDIFYK